MKGLSPIAMAREAIRLALATEEFGARFFGNWARPGGILEHPGVVKDTEKLRKSWEEVYKGFHNSHKIAVLEEVVKYHEIGIPPEDAQFLETRKFQLNEANDIRELEDMNPIPEEAGGDLYLVNGNMLPVSLVGSKKEGGENLNGQTEKKTG